MIADDETRLRQLDQRHRNAVMNNREVAVSLESTERRFVLRNSLQFRLDENEVPGS